MDNPQPRINVFTTIFNGLAREIINNCGISLPFDGRLNTGETPPKVSPVKALWDTGATGSAITPAVAKSLGLIPTTKANVQHADGISLQNVYLVNIYLPNNVVVPFVKVTECKNFIGNFDIIIGMDIISIGDFAITNVGQKTTFSFRIPSLKTIDYVKEFNDIYHKPTILGKKLGRNDPCDCGSGLKYKNCHGKTKTSFPN
jgi:predicted aspartyl protease